MDFESLLDLTRQYGGEWGVCHAKRLIHLVELLSAGAAYDREIIRTAACLHDWGGYTPWATPRLEHHLRSVEVATDFFNENGYPAGFSARVLECIANHHGGPAERAFESLLFTDADALDLLGVVGTLRVFAMNPRDLRAGWQALQRWRDLSLAAIRLPQSQPLAAERIQETNRLLADFERETFGIF